MGVIKFLCSKNTATISTIIQKDIGLKQNHLAGDGLLWRGKGGVS